MPIPSDHDQDQHPETLRPLADDIEPPESYVRPSRAPWVIGGIVVAAVAVAALFAISSRPSNLASVQAVLDEAKQRQVAEETRALAQPGQPAPATNLAAMTEKIEGALPAATKKCGVTLEPGAHVDVRFTVAPDGSITHANVVSTPFAMTALGSCIADALAKTKVTGFEGKEVTFTRSLYLR